MQGEVQLILPSIYECLKQTLAAARQLLLAMYATHNVGQGVGEPDS